MWRTSRKLQFQFELQEGMLKMPRNPLRIFLDALFHFDSTSNIFAFNHKQYYYVGASLWHDGILYKCIRFIAAIFLLVFWIFKLIDFYNQCVPFQIVKFIGCLSLNIVHFMGLYKYILLVCGWEIYKNMFDNNFSIKIKDKKEYFEIIEFINAREFNSNDQENFEIRRSRFINNQRFLGCLFFFGWLTVFIYCLFLTPLTDSQVEMEFPDDKMYLYYIMFIQTVISSVISSGIAMAGNFFLFSLLNFVSVEFKILANGFGKLLDRVDVNMSKNEILEIKNELKDYIKYYQSLLVWVLRLNKQNLIIFATLRLLASPRNSSTSCTSRWCFSWPCSFSW